VSIKGSPSRRLQQALETGNPLLVRTAAAELPRVGLPEALAICLLLLDAEPDSYPPAAARWAARFILEHPGVGVGEAQLVLSSLAALRGAGWVGGAWLSHVLRLSRDLGAARIVVEKNHGGGFLLGLLEQAMSETGVRVPYTIVSASQGKLTRAEPVAGLYERLKVHHVGAHEVLEEQMLQFTAGPGQKSPDRLDALVHALTDLLAYTRRPSNEEGIAIPYITDPRRAAAAGAVQWQDDFTAEDIAGANPRAFSGRSPSGPGRW
jgi:hypothetical protein